MTFALGLDVGGSTLKGVVLDSDHAIVHQEAVAVPTRDVLGFVVSSLTRLRADHPVSSVGVGLAGLVSHPTGDFVWGPHLDGASVPYRSVLTQAMGFEVAVDNDANLAAYAEWALGAGERVDPMLLVTLGTGIGIGLVIDGRIYRGRSFAGEAGHMQMVGDGEACSCGRTGCWETMVSGHRLDRLAAEIAHADPAGPVARLAGEAPPSGIHLARAAASGDQRSMSAVAAAGEWLGRGLANIVLLFDPARIVIGGAAAAAGEVLLGPARSLLAQVMSGSPFRPAVPVVPARFGPLSGAVGAALVGKVVQNERHAR